MRTTVTLDSDVEQLLRARMKERGLSFKEALNQSIRAGAAKDRTPRRFVQRAYAMGANPRFPWDRALAISDAIEDEEILRKLALGK